MLKKDKELKLYYSIKEVAQKLGVNESTLRYWEKEFPQLKPKTQALNKVRQYTAEDMELLKTIYNLVKVRGFKLAAARKMLNENRRGADRSSEVLGALAVAGAEAPARRNGLSGERGYTLLYYNDTAAHNGRTDTARAGRYHRVGSSLGRRWGQL